MEYPVMNNDENNYLTEELKSQGVVLNSDKIMLFKKFGLDKTIFEIKFQSKVIGCF